MKSMTRKLRGRYLRKAVVYFLTYCMIVNTWLPAVLALESANVISSSGATPTQWGDHTIIDTDNGAIINWNNFNTSAGQAVTFNQYLSGELSSMSAVLNRISSGAIPTEFNGALGANGRVFIVNPAGVIFGAGSTVDVAQLVASSLDISDLNFGNGRYEFSAGWASGAVINNGVITASEGAALIGSRVLNAGTITTGPGGFVVMAAGDRVFLGQPGSKIIVEMDSVTSSGDGVGDVVNEGGIEAPGGTIVLAAGDLFSVPLHPQLRVNSGTVEVPVYEVADQPVRVESGIGTVTQSGTINADGGSVVLTAGNTTAEDDDNTTLEDDIPDVILSTGSITQAVGGEVIAYAHDFGTKGTTTGAITSFEDGAVINVGTGTAEISGNHVLFAGSVDALPGGTIQVDPVRLTIADTMPVTGPELDTLYEEEHVEFYSQAGVNLDLAADELITVEYMTGSVLVGEITGGSGDIYLRNVFADGGIYFEQEDESGQTGPRSSIRTEAYYESAEVYRDGGNIYMDAGSGGIVAGDLITGTKAQDKMSQPGEIVLRTANGGDIEVGTMKAEGASSTQVSAISDGDLIVNGNIQSINKQTDNTQQSVFSATMCLLAEGDIRLNGTSYEVFSHGKGELVSDIRISAGENVYIGSAQAPATIEAESKVAQQGIATKSTAYIVIHAGRNLSEPGVIMINGQSYTPGAAYLSAITAVALNGGVNASNTPSSSDDTKTVWQNVNDPAAFFAKIEINSNETVPLNEGPCQDCPQPPGLPPVPRLFIIADDSLTVGWAAENAPLDVLANDDNGNPLVDGIVFEHTTTTGGGILTEIRDGGEVIGFEYTPPEDAVFTWDGVSDYAEFTDTFTYKAEDSEGNVSINTATVTITATNFLPTASGDSETIHMSTAGNPTSADFDLSEIIVDSDGTPGTLTLAKGDNDVVFGVASVDDSTDTATYVPFEGYVGNDDFDYTVTDSTIDYQGEPVTSATLGVTVENEPPTGSGDLGIIHMDQIDIQTQVNLTSPVSVEDVDGVDPLSIVEDTYIGSNGGTLVYDGTDWTYTPNPATPGYVGDPDGSADETFTIQIWDSQYDYNLDQAVTVDAQVVVELDNTLPTGSGDLGIIHMDQIDIQTQVNLTSPVSVEDVDGVDPLSIVEDTYIGSNGGTLVYDGTDWTYTPNPATPGYVGDPDGLPDETFTIQIWDSQYDYELDQAVTADAQVAVELTNVLPFAGESFLLDKPAGVPINEDFPGYDLPDTFAEGEIDALTMTLLENGGTLNPDGTLTTALGGTVTLAPDGESFTYDPPSDSFLGPDSFTFEVWDGQRDYPIEGDPTNVTVTGTITISFISAPTPPPAVPFTQPAPGLERVEIVTSGCPALMAWTAAELGVNEGRIQVQIANALASSIGIQPCDACAGLKQAATILQDAEGTHIAALGQVINEFASSTAPPSEEQMTSIANVMANNVGAANQYAAAGEYIDALAKYVGVLNGEMGFSIDEAIQLVTDKYVAPLSEAQNAGLAAYVAARLAALGGS